jgi:hypothetical protein
MTPLCIWHATGIFLTFLSRLPLEIKGLPKAAAVPRRNKSPSEGIFIHRPGRQTEKNFRREPSRRFSRS